MSVSFASKQITTPPEMEATAHFGDGYDTMGCWEKLHWVPVAGWGRDGWDFLEWPYYMGFIRSLGTDRHQLATYCEGDTDVYEFATKEERSRAMDELAFWKWQSNKEPWVEGVASLDDAPWLRGSYTKHHYRRRVMAGERIPVRIKGEGEQNTGVIYWAPHHHGPGDGAIVFDVREGWAGGVVEAICDQNSSYLDEKFMENAIEVAPKAEHA